MKKNIRSAIVLCLSLCSWGALALDTGDTAAPLRLEDVSSGEQFVFQASEGSVVVLDFWATWCPSCVVSLPHLNEIAKRYKPQGLRVIAISVDKNRKKLNSFLKKHKLANLTVLHDPQGSTASQYALTQFPTTFLVGPKGTIVARYGSMKANDQQHLEAQLEKLFATTPQ